MAINTIETLHIIKEDILNGMEIGYNKTLIPQLDYAVNCVKIMIESHMEHDD